MNTKKLGNLTELECITSLYKLGCSVSIPFGNADKYDLILDVNGNLYKVQCKHSCEVFDSDGELEYIKIKTHWQSHNRKGYKRNKYKPEEVDFFATYFDNTCYLIPTKECSFEKHLRVKNTKNKQLKKVSYLSDYLAAEVISKL